VIDSSILGDHEATHGAPFDDSGIVMDSPASARPDKPERSPKSADEGEKGDMKKFFFG
jgi:hypothetical protein